MAASTPIEWTDATWNPITGCSVISPGCTNCYAMRLAGTRLQKHPSRAGLTKPSKAGPVWTGEVRFNEEWLTQPLLWRRPRLIFVCAHADLFHESVPDAWIDRVFAVMALAPQHTFQVLTKRVERMQAYFAGCGDRANLEEHGFNRLGTSAWRFAEIRKALGDVAASAKAWDRLGAVKALPLPNLWLGVSAEDQRRADERRNHLGALAAAGWTTFVSYEPALGPINWTGWEFLAWAISGGENGPRPSHPAWHRAMRDFCAAHGIPYLFKQWGSWRFAPDLAHLKEGLRVEWTQLSSQIDGVRPALMVREGKKAAGRLLDGREHNGMPPMRVLAGPEIA